MKRIICLLLLTVMSTALFSGCEPEYLAETFYGADMLEAYGLSDLPAPKLENARLSGRDLYCDLTQDEYEAYVAEVVAYLKSRADVYHLCYRHDRTLLFGAFPQDTCVPLPESYDFTGSAHCFVFSLTEALNGDMMSEPVRIYIVRENGNLSHAEYNTVITIEKNTVSARIDPCAAEHTYDAGTAYPVPGLDRSITIYSCIHCGSENRDEYLDSRKSCSVTVAKGRNQILSNNWNQTVSWDIDSMHAGAKFEITVRDSAQGRAQLLVNGEKIPALRADENTQTFGFIMPEADIVIEIVPATEATDP